MATKLEKMALNAQKREAQSMFFSPSELLKMVDIDPSGNIRTDYDIETLVKAIQFAGEVHEPLEIRRTDSEDSTDKPYMIASDGHRRYYAIKWMVENNKHKTILDVPASLIVGRPSTVEATLRQLSSGTDNGKKLLCPLEEAKGFLILIRNKFVEDHKALSRKINKTPQYIYARMCLLQAECLHPFIDAVGLNICETLARTFIKEDEQPWLLTLVSQLATISEEIDKKTGEMVEKITVHPDGLSLAADICNRHGLDKKEAAMRKLKGEPEPTTEADPDTPPSSNSDGSVTPVADGTTTTDPANTKRGNVVTGDPSGTSTQRALAALPASVARVLVQSGSKLETALANIAASDDPIVIAARANMPSFTDTTKMWHWFRQASETSDRSKLLVSYGVLVGAMASAGMEDDNPIQAARNALANVVPTPTEPEPETAEVVETAPSSAVAKKARKQAKTTAETVDAA